jgi:Ca2+-binding RTX toxin-like protein
VEDAVEVDAGGGDDHVLISVGYAIVFGGPGNDTLEGFATSDYSNWLYGGPGDDVICGTGTRV